MLGENENEKNAPWRQELAKFQKDQNQSSGNNRVGVGGGHGAKQLRVSELIGTFDNLNLSDSSLNKDRSISPV